jgi:hypothetical protein
MGKTIESYLINFALEVSPPDEVSPLDENIHYSF